MNALAYGPNSTAFVLLAIGCSPHGRTDVIEASVTLRLPGAAFQVRDNVLVAPVIGIDDTRLPHVRVAAQCKAPTIVLLCVRAIDPMSAQSTAILEECTRAYTPCGPDTGIVDITLPTSFVIGARSMIELVIESPAIGCVTVRGASVELLAPL